ncbi:L,D-transpeptidase [Peptoniphilus harei]|uniref:L,D-transpeptidase n=1 Tax=Peptoniphilus harei TaxID=54005 RepID=UPI003983F8FD
MKKIKRLGAFILVASLLPSFVSAKGFVRQNDFMDKSGHERTHALKKWQARMNLPVTGGMNDKTNQALYTQNYEVYDMVTNPPTSGNWIVVNKSRRTLTLYKGGQSIGKFPVTLGTSSTPTPSAKAKIQNMHKNPAWGGMGGKYTPVAANDPRNPLGERWMGLRIPGMSGYGIHGNIKPLQIGGYYSNGCIRMFNYDIENVVFPKMKVGAPVWLGTDVELESWGVYQYSRPKKAEPKLVEKKEPPKEVNKNPVEEVPAGDLLEF